MKLNVWKSFKKKNTEMPSSLGNLLNKRECGSAVRWGHLEMIPLFGSSTAAGSFAAPEGAIRLMKVTHYGQMILENQAKLPTIVPLHLGYFQNAAQNHAMCVSALLDAGESREFKDACCIQAAQGGYIQEADERFIILPQPLRNKALALRGEENYSKLWGDISSFNKSLGLKNRGHLDELKRAYQPELLRTLYHLEASPEQTGAVFLCNNTVVGIELAPDANFWNDLHRPLVMYCYAPLRLIKELAGIKAWTGETLAIEKPTGINDIESAWIELVARRQERINGLMNQLKALPIKNMKIDQELGQNQLLTIDIDNFVGQIVLQDNQAAYVSLSRIV